MSTFRTGIAIPDDDITALLPDPENAKYIRIEENIPVTAFGYLVPPVEKKLVFSIQAILLLFTISLVTNFGFQILQ